MAAGDKKDTGNIICDRGYERMCACATRKRQMIVSWLGQKAMRAVQNATANEIDQRGRESPQKGGNDKAYFAKSQGKEE